MNLKDAREHYYFHTGKVSDIVRQLGLGAIAIVWLFRSGDTTAAAIPLELLVWCFILFEPFSAQPAHA